MNSDVWRWLFRIIRNTTSVDELISLKMIVVNYWVDNKHNTGKLMETAQPVRAWQSRCDWSGWLFCRWCRQRSSGVGEVAVGKSLRRTHRRRPRTCRRCSPPGCCCCCAPGSWGWPGARWRPARRGGRWWTTWTRGERASKSMCAHCKKMNRTRPWRRGT